MSYDPKNPTYDPIVPSSLFGAEDPSHSNNADYMSSNNFSIKSGVILKTYEIDNEKNLTKTAVEYDVIVLEKKTDGGFATSLYKRCVALEQFGALSDFFEFKMRNPTKTDFYTSGKISDSDGSLVLMLCLNGDSEKGIIIGSLKHPSRKSKLTKEAGQHLEGEYNGLNWKINKDGELVIKFNSATDNKGKVKSAEAQGSFAKFDKEGNIEVGTQVVEDKKEEAEILSLSKKNKKVRLRAREFVEIEASQKDLNLKSGESLNATVGKDLLIKAQGKATIMAQADMGIAAQGNLDIKGASIMVKSNGSLDVQASTVNVNSSSIFLGRGGMPALTLNTLFYGIGNLGMPTISQPFAGFSSSVFIAS